MPKANHIFCLNRWLVWATAIAVLAGCGGEIPKNVALTRAQAVYAKAEAEPEISNHAPVALHEAERLLKKAEHALKEEADEQTVTHMAGLAEKKVNSAIQIARRKVAEQRARELGERQRDIQLRSREMEAERAREEARRFKAEAEEARKRAEKLEKELSQLAAHRTERGLVMTIGDMLFDPGKAELMPGAMREINKLVAFLKDHPDRAVLIEGHTDNQGSRAYNLKLSRQRAKSVKNALVKKGVSGSRITTQGYGFAYPVASNASEAGRQQNRRVEIIVLDKGVDAQRMMR